jgi:hypothetical protein
MVAGCGHCLLARHAPKNPLVALIWFIIVIARYFSPGQRATLRAPWLPLSVLLALLLMAIWPLIQMAAHHVSLSEVFRFDEARLLLGPSRLGSKPFLEIPFRLITNSLSFLWELTQSSRDVVRREDASDASGALCDRSLQHSGFRCRA